MNTPNRPIPLKGHRFKMWLSFHWVKLLIGGIVLVLIGLSIWGLSSLESFYRKLTIANMPVQLLMAAVHAGIFVAMYSFFLRGGMSKMDKKGVKGKLVDVHWDDVLGIDAAKQEAWELVQLIKDRTRIKKIGGKIIRGVLMVGPPGCGKTYLAKAIATEAGVPFMSMAASEFNEVFVGVGASRVRKLFKEARALAYGYGACIIFIDELDAIGRHRQLSFGGGGSETNATQNQLLVEMDGLKGGDSHVIVMGATNASEESLDDALLRPGRFDRKIYIDRPDLVGREQLFKFYLSKVSHDASMDVGRLARKAIHKSPADIENIIKESALIATRNEKDAVSYREITEAMERIDLGAKHHRKMNETERRAVAYHESGHLVTLYLLHPTDDVFKASIISRRDSLGVVYHQPREEFYTERRDEILADIKVALAGYGAEKVKFGITSSGVSGDFQTAMSRAHNMVWRLGMGTNGFLGDYTVIPKDQLSDQIKHQLNQETQKIVHDCVTEVIELLTENEHLLDRFATELLEREELEYDDIEAIFSEYGIQPYHLRPGTEHSPPGSSTPSSG